VAGALLAGFVVVPGAVSLASPAAAGPAYVPPAGPTFNNPIGTAHQQRRLLDQVIRMTDNAPAGSAIRMAVFSFGDPATADALLAAHRRGVRVKLVFSGANEYPAMKRLQAGLGADPTQKSFAVFCERSCRGTAGEMHAKYFSFSRTGAARHVTTVGSVNLTRNNAENQWSDLFTRVDDEPYFKAYTHWFTQLKRDVPVEPTYLRRVVGTTVVEMAPFDLAKQADPVVEQLDRIRCEVPMGEIDPDAEKPDEIVPTNVDINAHAWNEERGKQLAWRVASLDKAGCRVRVFYGVGLGAAVRSILENNGVNLRKGTHPGVRTHQKVLVVEGGYDGDPSTVRAWTGSHNWSDRALHRDDLIVEIQDEAEARQYAEWFEYMWKNA
jgi:phosphatidylserine/phosphatidylglycerophosphate/cardiolipin synthase-like enzyme